MDKHPIELCIDDYFSITKNIYRVISNSNENIFARDIDISTPSIGEYTFTYYELLNSGSFTYLGKRKSLLKRFFSSQPYTGVSPKPEIDLWSIDNKKFLKEIKTLDAEHLQMLSSNLTALKLEVDALLIDIL